MSFRITTNGMFRSYQSSLTNANSKLQKSMAGVSTHRAFSTYAEDPANASKAFQLRRTMWRTSDHMATSQYLLSKFQSGYVALAAIVDGTADQPGLDGLSDALQGLTETAGAARRSLGQDLVAKAESVALDMNVRYSDEYVFAGTDGLNPPFLWEGSKLMYRGIDVSAASGTEDYRMLQEMSEEKSFVDIGLGMQSDGGTGVIESSAFNSSVPGIDFLNYGVDEDGDPKNLAVLMRTLGNIYLNTDEKGNFHSEEEAELAERLTQKLTSAISYTQEQHVKLSSDSNYLQTNLNQLTDASYTLNEEIDELEQQNPANAIMSMYWAQYCYQASLRIGTDLLSQSLFDYMR